MSFDLLNLKGMTDDLRKKLSEVGIEELDGFRKATSTEEKRRKLAEECKITDEALYHLAKQAQLIWIPGVSPEDADFLISVGVRSIKDLSDCQIGSLLSFMEILKNNSGFQRRIPMEYELSQWIDEAKQREAFFETDEDDLENGFLMHRERKSTVSREVTEAKKESFYNDMSDVIIEIGNGIATAQHQLDLSSIDIQNEILKSEELSSYGVNATWYTIPEVNFTLKMEYSIVQEKNQSGNLETKRMKLIPSNAKYNNYFKQSKLEESTLNIKFVPVPPLERFTERVVMPNLLGRTLDEALEVLENNRILIGKIDKVNGTTNNGKASEVTGQSIEPSKVILINENVDITVTEQ